jgi:adenine-specific DNA-methyltransferase
MIYNLQNRRFIGNKFKLLSFIDSILIQERIPFHIFADMFAGTGVVAEHFMQKGKKIIVNDNLYSNYIFYTAWLSNLKYSKNKIKRYIDYYNNSQEFIRDNYFSDTFSKTYFHYEDAKKIGSIREHLEINKKSFTKREFSILLSSLLYTTDKLANTVGHFESFLSTPPLLKGVILNELNIKQYKKTPCIYQQDANKLIRKIKADIVYLDPPYNSRQYINFYHLLENLAEWKKPLVSGKTLKMPRADKMSSYSKASALECMIDLISNVDAKYILLSYNNTYKANSGASINKISEDDLYKILSNLGKTKKFEMNHKFFNAGKTDFKNHKEYLFLCKIIK